VVGNKRRSTKNTSCACRRTMQYIYIKNHKINRANRISCIMLYVINLSTVCLKWRNSNSLTDTRKQTWSKQIQNSSSSESVCCFSSRAKRIEWLFEKRAHDKNFLLQLDFSLWSQRSSLLVSLFNASSLSSLQLWYLLEKTMRGGVSYDCDIITFRVKS